MYREGPNRRQRLAAATQSNMLNLQNDTGSAKYTPSSTLSIKYLFQRQFSNRRLPDHMPRFASWKRPFFSRRHAQRSASWKPVTFTASVLIPLFLITITFIIILGLLNRKMDRDKGLFFAASSNDFDRWQIFCYRYLPTTLGVMYGMILQVVDLDVKRLEPYFQLSKLNGASGKDSMLLNYPFETLAFVPINAFRRRHWVVFISGFSLIVTSWIITPLQSSILATQIVTRTIPTSFVPSKELPPLEKQDSNLTSQFEYAAYGVAWLGEELAPFLTREYAAVPFRPVGWDSDHMNGGGGNESWAAYTRVYSTIVDCQPGSVEYRNDSGSWYITNNLNTCTVGEFSLQDAVHAMWYYTPQSSRFSIAPTFYSGCNDTNLFVGVWAWAPSLSAQVRDQEIRGIFCKARYFYSDTVVSVDGATLRINNSQTIEPTTDSTFFEQKDNIMNITTLERDMIEVTQLTPSGVDYRTGPSSTFRIDSWNISEPTRILEYIIACGGNSTFDDFKDTNVFSAAVGKAHQLLFSNAVHQLLQPIPEGSIDEAQPVAGSRLVRSTAVIAISKLVYILQGFLGLVALCIAVLFFSYHYRRNNLFSDPDSLSAKMALVADSKPLLEDFEGLDDCSEPGKYISSKKYRLDVWADGTEKYRLDKVYIDSHDTHQTFYIGGTKDRDHMVGHNGTSVIPLEMRLWVGIALAVALLGLLVLVCVLYKSSLKYHGLPTLTNSQIGIQVIFSFVPTMIATLLEPFWAVITRSTCAYQPYVELHKGDASAASTLGVKYTNLPAALVLPRAVRSGKFLISSLSAVTLLASFLAVVLGSLFETELLPIAKPDTFTQALEPLIRAQTSLELSQENYLVASTNITAGTTLPPFVSPEYYFLPFTWNTSASGNGSNLHTAVTRGFGGNVTCQPLESESLHLEYFTPKLPLRGRGLSQFWGNNFNVTVPATNRTGIVNCTAFPAGEYFVYNSWTEDFSGEPGPVAGELMFDLEPTIPNADQGTWDECRRILIIGWARGVIWELYADAGTFGFIPGTYKNTTLFCQQEIFSADFEVVVDGSQRVQSYTQVSPFDIGSANMQGGSITAFTAQIAHLFMAGSGANDLVGGVKSDSPGSPMDDAKFHNESIAAILPHLLVGSLLNNTVLSDPATPVPEFDLVSEGFQDLYRRLFAITLSLYSDHIFVRSETNHTISGTTTAEYQRISINKPMFIVTLILLGINILIAVITWAVLPRRLLPRFPDNLAADIGFFYASQALRDVSGTAPMASKARKKHLEGLGFRYGYGIYVGRDGKIHRGVERQSHLLKDGEYSLQEYSLQS